MDADGLSWIDDNTIARRTDRMSVEMNSEMDRLQDLDGWRDG